MEENRSRPLRLVMATGPWLMGRALYFLAIVFIAIPVLFLRAGFTPRYGGLPGFDVSRYLAALRLYVGHLLDGDFGPPYKLNMAGEFIRAASGVTIDAMVQRTLAASLIIFLCALLLGMAAGLVAGLLVSRFAPPWLRGPAGYLNMIALSFPDVLLLVLVQFGLINLGQWLGFEPLAPYGEWHGGLTLHTAIMPILMLSFFPAAYIARVVATAFDEIFTAEYIRTARAKGLSGWRILRDHTLRNGLIPILGGLPTASSAPSWPRRPGPPSRPSESRSPGAGTSGGSGRPTAGTCR